MIQVTWDHVHLRSPDPEATAAWLRDILGGEIVRGPGRIDVKLGGANVFIAPVSAGDGVNAPPLTPYQGLQEAARVLHGLQIVSITPIFVLIALDSALQRSPPIHRTHPGH